MIKYKGYSIWNGASKWERPNWHVGTVQDDGRMVSTHPAIPHV